MSLALAPRRRFLVLVGLLLAAISLAAVTKYFFVHAEDTAISVSPGGTKRASDGRLLNLVEPKKSCCSSKAKSESFSAVAAPEYETYKLTATYYTLRDGLTATLMLNNKGPQPMLATPTFYSLAGTRLTLAPITVPAASYFEVNMHTLLAGAADEFREGSMKITYEGKMMQLGAQMKLAAAENNLLWAEQFVYTTKFTSSRLENVWYLPYDNTDTSRHHG